MKTTHPTLLLILFLAITSVTSAQRSTSPLAVSPGGPSLLLPSTDFVISSYEHRGGLMNDPFWPPLSSATFENSYTALNLPPIEAEYLQDAVSIADATINSELTSVYDFFPQGGQVFAEHIINITGVANPMVTPALPINSYSEHVMIINTGENTLLTVEGNILTYFAAGNPFINATEDHRAYWYIMDLNTDQILGADELEQTGSFTSQVELSPGSFQLVFVSYMEDQFEENFLNQDTVPCLRFDAEWTLAPAMNLGNTIQAVYLTK